MKRFAKPLADTSTKPWTAYYKRAYAELARLEVEAQRLRELPEQNEDQLAANAERAKKYRIYVEVMLEHNAVEADPD